MTARSSIPLMVVLNITGLNIQEVGRPGEGVRFVIIVPEGIFREK